MDGRYAVPFRQYFKSLNIVFRFTNKSILEFRVFEILISQIILKIIHGNVTHLKNDKLRLHKSYCLCRSHNLSLTDVIINFTTK